MDWSGVDAVIVAVHASDQIFLFPLVPFYPALWGADFELTEAFQWLQANANRYVPVYQ